MTMDSKMVERAREFNKAPLTGLDYLWVEKRVFEFVKTEVERQREALESMISLVHMDSPPPDGQSVLLLISDLSVAIEQIPIVAWRAGKEWWTGIPGNYIHIKTAGPGAWELKGWRPLGYIPPPEDR